MDWTKIIKSQKNFNGMPLSYWQERADELVMDKLVHAGHGVDAEHSIIGYLARIQLLKIAENHNPKLFKKVCKQHKHMQDSFIRGIMTIISDVSHD